MSQQPPPPGMPPMMPDPQQQDMSGTSYYPQEPNDLTGGLPINLDSLRDGPPGSKPFYPYSTLIRYVPPSFVVLVAFCSTCTHYRDAIYIATPLKDPLTKSYSLKIFTMQLSLEYVARGLLLTIFV